MDQDAVITNEEQKAIELVESNFMTIADMQEELGINSYQYARTLVQEDRFGLGTNSVSIFGRTIVNNRAVAAAKAAREERAQRQEEAREAKAAAKAEGKSKKKAKKAKKAVEAEEPVESLDDLIS